MKTYINLNKNIDCNYICSKINHIISKYNITENTVLICELKDSVDEYTEPIKLEHKEITE